MKWTVTLHGLRELRLPLLLIGATVLAIASLEIDQVRMAESIAAFSGGNAVPIHRIGLDAFLPRPEFDGPLRPRMVENDA